MHRYERQGFYSLLGDSSTAYISRRSAIYRQPSARGRSCETVGMCVRDTRH